MKTKFIRVATSGKTIDGREITPAKIDQMAATYNPGTYAARVWMEHYRSLLPDSPFKAYGDVLSVKAETVEDGKRALFAQVDATNDLVKLNADRQKLFWSIEITDNFANSGNAYLTGLAVTDSPASLGTEMLTFAVKSGKAPEAIKSQLFSTAVEAILEVEEQPKDTGPSILDKVKGMFSAQAKAGDQRVAQAEEALTVVAGELSDLKAKAANFASADAVKDVAAQLAKLATDLGDLTTKLSHTPNSLPRPLAAGGEANQTDC